MWVLTLLCCRGLCCRAPRVSRGVNARGDVNAVFRAHVPKAAHVRRFEKGGGVGGDDVGVPRWAKVRVTGAGAGAGQDGQDAQHRTALHSTAGTAGPCLTPASGRRAAPACDREGSAAPLPRLSPPGGPCRSTAVTTACTALLFRWPRYVRVSTTCGCRPKLPRASLRQPAPARAACASCWRPVPFPALRTPPPSAAWPLLQGFEPPAAASRPP